MKKKILVIDDDPGILKTVRRYIEPEGYQVLVAESGKEGLAVFEEQKPQLACRRFD